MYFRALEEIECDLLQCIGLRFNDVRWYRLSFPTLVGYGKLDVFTRARRSEVIAQHKRKVIEIQALELKLFLTRLEFLKIEELIDQT